MTERIVHAALRLPDRILSGQSHVEIIKEFLRAHGDNAEMVEAGAQRHDGVIGKGA